MKILLVINPTSGGGKGNRVGNEVRELCNKLQLDFEYVLENSLESTLTNTSQQLANEKFDVLCAVGGDGLIHDLLPLLVKDQIPLLIFPAGTGNDFARTVHHFGRTHQKILRSLKELPEIKSHDVDIGVVKSSGESNPFVQIISTGFDSLVNERANNFRLIKGKFKYIVAVLLEIAKCKAIPFEISVDGVTTKVDAMLVCVANGSTYGGGMKIVPHAKNDDDLLELMYVAKVSALRLLFVFPRVFFGAHVNHPKVHFMSGKEIRLAAPTIAYGDGERIGPLPIHAKLSEQKIRVVTI